MANSILGGSRSPGATPGFNPNGNPNQAMLQQLINFKQQFNGNPQQAVMQMLSQGKINNNQLQQAMQTAKQLSHLIK